MNARQATLSQTAAAAAALSLLVGCTAPAARPSAPPAELLTGTALFGVDVRDPGPEREDVLGTDAQMRAFVAAQVEGIRNPEVKLRKLLAGMGDQGLFSLDYAGTETKTATQTFYDRKGNCLSFTILFVALAREAGLDVSFQTVDIPPVWTSDTGLVILNNHINALVRLGPAGNYEIDFNNVESKGNYQRQPVSDEYALALYHSNLGVQYLQARDDRQSFAELRAAIRAYPRIPGPWVNLGVLYSRNERYGLAESAYLEALQADPRNLSALSNLASLNRQLGNEERAEEYFSKVRSYQERNPYYYYYLAGVAYGDLKLDEALGQIEHAIRLKHDEHQFYFLRGLIHYKLGKRDEARSDFAEAHEYAEYDDVKRRYEAKMAALAGA